MLFQSQRSYKLDSDVVQSPDIAIMLQGIVFMLNKTFGGCIFRSISGILTLLPQLRYSGCLIVRLTLKIWIFMAICGPINHAPATT